MSIFNQFNSNEEELTSPSSDEKMDTGSESFRSQDTPNSIRSSDFEDNPENVLRLQNPGETGDIETPDVFKSFSETETPNPKLTNLEVLKTDVFKTPEAPKNSVLRLSTPENVNLNNKMASLKMDVRPSDLGVGPPKFSSTLTLTTSHPLMGLGSPDDFPDLIPKKHKEDEKDLSLSSIEDERPNDTNGLYSPQRNTSKNNLYFTESYVSAESHMLSDRLDLAPDVVTRVERRKIVPKIELTRHRILDRNEREIKDDFRPKLSSNSTPKCSLPVDITTEEFHSGVAEWCESPSQLRAMPNFDLPIEMSSAIGMHDDLNSPDVVSSSTQEERSAYEAKLDPYTGSVALRQTTPRGTHHQRRKIQLPSEDSLDSVSVSSIESEDEPPAPEPQPEPPAEHPADDANMSDDDTRRSKSTNTISYSSEPIPEYSLCEEMSNEREWLTVRSHPCDVKVIEPYKRVLSHGGYSASGVAIIVFSACHLPDNARHDYTYVMDNLFLYVMWSLERLVTDEYLVVYLHGSAARRRLPAFHWLHECYKLIDRRLRKSLKQLYLVHPTFWLKSFVLITKPFVSSKFVKKLCYVKNLDELMEKVPVDPNAIPEIVKQYDATKKR